MDKKKKIYGKSGLLSGIIPEYKDRPQQIQMSNLVNSAVKKDTHLVVEAPTGVGKSVGALVPLLTRLKNDEPHRQLLICTATINLQEQYLKKELPLMREIGFDDFTFGLLKGMGNFACRFKMHHTLLERKNEATKVLSEWEKTTVSGDFSELTREQLVLFSSFDIACDYEECLRNKCPYYGSCYYFVQRNYSQTSDVIIANYHYFLSHMKLVLLHDSFILLPRVSNILFDEAHVLPELSRDFFGYSLGVRSFKRIVDFVNKHYPDVSFDLDKHSKKFFQMLEGHLGNKSMRLIYDLNSKHYQERWAGLLLYLSQSRAKIDAEVRHMMTALGDLGSSPKILLHARKLSKQCGNIIALMSEIEKYLVDKEKAHLSGQSAWVERDRDMNITLATKPIYVNQYFTTALPKLCNQATFMSATLEPNSFIKSLGITDIPKVRYATHILDQVFDYEKNAALYLPSLGQPNTEEFDVNVAEFMADLCKMLGGGILGLFTSYVALEKAAYRVRALPQGTLHNELLVQDRIKSADFLSNEFKKGDRVLLGTKSFFQGVDFPGDIVKVVFLNKIPFKDLNDPVIQALQYFGEDDWFNSEQLPYAIVTFKQAAGRLIRRETDTGVIICADPRLITAGYGSILIGALPKGLPVITAWDMFLNKLDEFCVV